MTESPYLGSRKVTIRLQEEGHSACRQHVQRLLQQLGLRAVQPKKCGKEKWLKSRPIPTIGKPDGHISESGLVYGHYLHPYPIWVGLSGSHFGPPQPQDPELTIEQYPGSSPVCGHAE